jgi:hypothetical protein
MEYGLYQGVTIFGPLLYLLKNAETVEQVQGRSIAGTE